MSHTGQVSPQLRSRKSKMVPRVSLKQQDPQPRENEDKELKTPNMPAAGGDNNPAGTPLQAATHTLVDDSSSPNGRVVETSFTINTTTITGSDNDEDEDDGGGGGDNNDRRPLLAGSGGGRRRESVEILDGGDMDSETLEVVRVVEEPETSLSIMLQVLVPYLIAGFGMVGAGMVLDVVQHTPVFTTVTELFILVPALLGLKGNLEMTLASRLSTQANLGNMDTRREKFLMIGGNMALIQAQATVVGFLASMFAMVMGWIPKGEFPLDHAVLLVASSLFTAAVASFVLGSLMVGVVLLSTKMKVNPDNVATPIAASLGDLITLALLAGVASLLFSAIGKHPWLAPSIVVVFFLLLPLWVTLSVRNKYTNDVILSGWSPVICAMAISSIGGVILDFAVTQYPGIAIFQPVINGVGGNLVAVQASRISTYLHKRGRPGELPAGISKGCANPITFFIGKTSNSRAARVLLLLVIPGHLIFIYTIYYMKAGHTSITILFNVFYLLAAVLQVILLLYISQWLVHLIWRKGEDPDNVAIPYLTALGDLLGTGFLALAFQALYLLGDRDADIGE